MRAMDEQRVAVLTRWDWSQVPKSKIDYCCCSPDDKLTRKVPMRVRVSVTLRTLGPIGSGADRETDRC